MSASAKTTFGDLPPSSITTGTTFSAAIFATATPTSTDPVKVSWLMPGWLASATPASLPMPGTTLRAPGGRPHARPISPRRRAVMGASLEGFTTTAQPAASAGATPRLPIWMG